MKLRVDTRPCEYCGTLVSKTATQQSQRKYWTCGRSCANKLRIQRGSTPNWNPNPLRGQRETRPCAECGAPVTRYLSQVCQAQVWTCSRSCKQKRRVRLDIEAGTYVRPTKPRRGETNPCEVCGKPVYRNASQAAKGVGRYCSPDCHNIAQTKTPVIKACANCGAEMRLQPSQAHLRYCSKACDGESRVKRPLVRRYNGKPARLNAQGYVMIWEPTHPNTSNKGWQYEHRVIAESMIGRYLDSNEHVHHVNGDKADNRPANLEVMDANDHAILSSTDYRDQVQREREELAEYRRRYGPLP